MIKVNMMMTTTTKVELEQKAQGHSAS